MSNPQNPQWVKYGERHGWLITGALPANRLSGGDFWSQASRVACAAEGGQVDMVQCYDAGIMTAGPLGFTAATETLPKLFAEMPRPVLAHHLGDRFAAHGIGLQSNPAHGVPRLVRGLRPLSLIEQREVFLGGSNGIEWTEEQQRIAFDWVVAINALLTDPATLRATAQAAGKLLSGYVAQEAATLLGFASPYSPPSQTGLRRAAACYLAYAINHPRGALRLLKAAGPDAERLMELAQHAGAWPETFAHRTRRLRAALDAETW
jgi:hypothetical protein